jgi:RNA polymerase sigma-70 factor, ECF subfamily
METGTDSIEQLHARFGGAVFDLCLRMLGREDEAEDAVQETFINAYRALPSFDFRGSYMPWLYRIATNACLKALRRRRPIAPVPADESATLAPFADPIEAIHAQRVLARLAQELDARSLEILVSDNLCAMDQGEIAAALGISRRAVVKRLAAVRRRAAEILEEDRGG